HRPTTLRSFVFVTPMSRPPPSSTLFPYTTLFRSTGVPYSAGVRESQWNPRSLRWNVIVPWVLIAVAVLTVITGRLPCEDLVGLRSEEHTSELQSRFDLVCRLLLEKKKTETQRRRG